MTQLELKLILPGTKALILENIFFFFLNLKYQSFVSTFFQSQVIHEIKKITVYIHSLSLFSH